MMNRRGTTVGELAGGCPVEASFPRFMFPAFRCVVAPLREAKKICVPSKTKPRKPSGPLPPNAGTSCRAGTHFPLPPALRAQITSIGVARWRLLFPASCFLLFVASLRRCVRPRRSAYRQKRNHGNPLAPCRPTQGHPAVPGPISRSLIRDRRCSGEGKKSPLFSLLFLISFQVCPGNRCRQTGSSPIDSVAAS